MGLTQYGVCFTYNGDYGVYMDYGSWRLEDLQELEELGLASQLESTHRKGFGTD